MEYVYIQTSLHITHGLSFTLVLPELNGFAIWTPVFGFGNQDLKFIVIVKDCQI